MNGDLFTLSGSLLVLAKFSCFLALSLQIQISLRDFFAHKNPLTFRNINIVKKKGSVLPHCSASLNQPN